MRYFEKEGRAIFRGEMVGGPLDVLWPEGWHQYGLMPEDWAELRQISEDEARRIAGRRKLAWPSE